ncbi:MAG: preprotein translocase subunit SecA [Xanthomonadaceae bacterium]|nr:preprotein translocase subunit SecA [Xanthomonadaceae bacterium]
MITTFEKFARKLFGTQNDRELKSITPIVAQINSFEPAIKALTDSQLQAKTPEFKARLAKGETLDQILPEAFAVVREAAWRVIGQRHYDVQMVGGITLHRGRIAEMKTGEGKTLVATLPSYLNALSGKGVHIVTVNDYLARRDSEWMGRIHRFLGLTVGIIVHGLNDRERKVNYEADITYGTNNEFGFDYLRDNMKFKLEDYVQRELNFAVVDEVDSILIDEARTPLIISGPSEDSTDQYYKINVHLKNTGLQKDVDYTVDEKSKTAALSESGVDKMESKLGMKNLYDPQHIETLHHVNQALRAHVLFKRDVDYVVQDGEVQIVDEFTGRLMPGRRWSDGLHQAIEAKEGVNIENENQTLATITFQNYFRMYNKLSGMTGTADTEATEFKQIYKLDVTVIPSNRIMKRLDESDLIYKSEQIKFEAIAEEIKKRHEKGQPCLVGTISIEKSELLSSLLKKLGLKHSVLNAKQHEREADIVAQAGRFGAITIATNMAGRGTDILLGGNPENLAKNDTGGLKTDATEEEKQAHAKLSEENLKKWTLACEKEKQEVLKAGGLFIVGTERHESRRIDNQLRGRSGRQGDPGGSKFYLSLDDDLMRIFGGSNIKKFMEDDVPIEHRWINKAVENAQKKVEAHNYDIRKHLLEYDDVMNQQRQVIYGWRKEVLARDHLKEMVFSMTDELASAISWDFFPNGKLKRSEGSNSLSMDEVNTAVNVTLQFPFKSTENEIVPFNDLGLKNLIIKKAHQFYNDKEAALGDSVMRQIEKMMLLTTIDQLWKDHLLAMDHLREGIGLQGYGQKDPLVEYKKQGFKFFEMMMNLITGDSVRKIFAIQFAPEDEGEFDEEDFEIERKPIRMQTNLTSDGTLMGGKLAPPTLPGQPLTPQQNNAQNNSSQKNRKIGGIVGNGGMGFGKRPQVQQPEQGSLSLNPAPQGSPKPLYPGVGRNDACPCGSGKKYKKCHGA